MSEAAARSIGEIDFSTLKKHQLEEVITKCNDELKVRYLKKTRRPKYGNLSKYMLHNKWIKFSAALHKPRDKLIFFLMKQLALRVGEVPRLTLDSIDLPHKHILMNTEKSGMPDFIYLDQETTDKLRSWIFTHYEEIKSHQGHIFFAEGSSHSKKPYLAPQVITRIFRTTCMLANIQITYGLARNSGAKLHLYTTHSLRHTGITDFWNKTKDLEKTRLYARHTNYKSLQTYIHVTEEEMREAVEGKGKHLSSEDWEDLQSMLQKFRIEKRV